MLCYSLWTSRFVFGGGSYTGRISPLFRALLNWLSDNKIIIFLFRGTFVKRLCFWLIYAFTALRADLWWVILQKCEFRSESSEDEGGNLYNSTEHIYPYLSDLHKVIIKNPHYYLFIWNYRCSPQEVHC